MPYPTHVQIRERTVAEIIGPWTAGAPITWLRALHGDAWIVGIEVTVTTSGVAGNRYPIMYLNDVVTGIYGTTLCQRAIIASKTTLLHATPGQTAPYVTDVGDHRFITLPYPYVVPYSVYLTIDLVNKDAGDTFTQLRIYYKSIPVRA